MHPSISWLLCSAHAEEERALSARLTRVLRAPRSGECAMPGCCKPMRARGLCIRHYQRAHRRGLFPSRRREQARRALAVLPGEPPALQLPAADLPPWVERRLDELRATVWAQLRQDLHDIAEVAL